MTDIQQEVIRKVILEGPPREAFKFTTDSSAPKEPKLNANGEPLYTYPIGLYYESGNASKAKLSAPAPEGMCLAGDQLVMRGAREGRWSPDGESRTMLSFSAEAIEGTLP